MGARSYRLGVATAFVDGALVPGDVEVDTGTGTLLAVGCSPAGRRGLAAPGFIDLQVNGYAGIDLFDATPGDYARINAALASDGVTSWLPTFPTSTAEATRDALGVIDTAGGGSGNQAVRSGEHGSATASLQEPRDAGAPGARPLGAHLEGPFLSPARRGAHPASLLRPVDTTYLYELRSCGPVRLVTLAPELPGAIDLIHTLVATGIVVSVGHTDATAAEAHAAFDAGATAHTHVGNAHRPLTSRDPGPAAAALHRPDVVPCFIGDLAHVHADALLVRVLAARERYVLVTDANAVTSARDLPRSRRAATIRDLDGAARLPDGSLCGGSLPLYGAVRNLVDLGRPLTEVLAAVTTRPAALLGEATLGRLRPGDPADVVVLDDALKPVSVLVGGATVEAPVGA